MRKKGDFELDIVSGVSMSKDYRGWSEKRKIEELLMPEVRGEGPDCFELTGKQQ